MTGRIGGPTDRDPEGWKRVVMGMLNPAADANLSRWKRLGVDLEAMCRVHASIREFWDTRPPERYTEELDQEACRWIDLGHYAVLATMHHLELPDVIAQPLQCAHRAAAVAVGLFFGEWRNRYEWNNKPVSLEQLRREQNWFDSYRNGLMLGLCMDNEQSVAQLILWPGRDLMYDEGAYNYKREDNYFQMVLAMHLRGEDSKDRAELAGLIRSGRGKRAKMLLRAFEAVVASDAKTLSKELLNLTKYHREYEMHPDRPSPLQAIMQDGSIVWHVARRKGMRLDDLPLDTMDRIIRRETLEAAEALQRFRRGETACVPESLKSSR